MNKDRFDELLQMLAVANSVATVAIQRGMSFDEPAMIDTLNEIRKAYDELQHFYTEYEQLKQRYESLQGAVNRHLYGKERT